MGAGDEIGGPSQADCCESLFCACAGVITRDCVYTCSCRNKSTSFQHIAFPSIYFTKHIIFCITSLFLFCFIILFSFFLLFLFVIYFTFRMTPCGDTITLVSRCTSKSRRTVYSSLHVSHPFHLSLYTHFLSFPPSSIRCSFPRIHGVPCCNEDPSSMEEGVPRLSC